MMKLKISKTMAGKTAVKAFLAVALLAGPAAVPAGDVNAAGVKATAAPTAQSTAPVMRDNLSKYGLVKDVELPVTVTAGGLSYTLEKIMIYEFNSSSALALRKQYKYGDISGLIASPKYLIWTKITIKNNSKKTVERSYKDILYKWNLSFADGGYADPVAAFSQVLVKNSKEALADFKLKPGEILTTYQALYYEKDFKYFRITLDFNGEYTTKYIVNDPELTQ